MFPDDWKVDEVNLVNLHECIYSEILVCLPIKSSIFTSLVLIEFEMFCLKLVEYIEQAFTDESFGITIAVIPILK